ncbi:MAG: DUF1700 domain-containing protein [Oscillospiraceae bacterium]|nr:DUF1700 domain-containing protein [Oscillospiraceae bacterium]
MGKSEFLEKLRLRLSGIPQIDADERVSFYSEMIDDRIEEGLTEEQAVNELGSIDEIVSQILSEVPLTTIVREKVKKNYTLRAWGILLIVLGSPIWLSLLVALFAVIISVYAAIWSVIVALWAVELSFVLGALCGVFGLGFFSVQGAIISAVSMLGAGLLLVGLAIFGFFGCKYLTIGTMRATKWVLIRIKSWFVKREAV